MITNNSVVMEAELGRLVFGLIPENTSKVMTNQDKSFNQILAAVCVVSNESKKDVDISLRIMTEYQFVGLGIRPTGGYTAVFQPRFWIYRSDRDWEGVSFETGKILFNELTEFTKNKVVETDIPDIEEMKTQWISVMSGRLVDAGSVWRIRK